MENKGIALFRQIRAYTGANESTLPYRDVDKLIVVKKKNLEPNYIGSTDYLYLCIKIKQAIIIYIFGDCKVSSDPLFYNHIAC